MNGATLEKQVRTILTASLALALLLPNTGHALTACGKTAAFLCDPTQNTGYYNGSDCDGDGYTDQQECEGFALAGSGKPMAKYNSADPTSMDPSTPDLLYLMVNTDLSTDIDVATGLLNNGQPSLLVRAMTGQANGILKVYADGLKIKAHLISYADTVGDRQTVNLTSTTKAAMIVENPAPAVAGSSNPYDTALGLTKEGRTSAQGIASSIYTYRIQKNVTDKCASDTSCSVKGTLPLITKITDIVNYYILQVTAHEMGHGSLLATANTDGLYHYSKSGTIMDPSVTFSRGVYTIPTTFDPTKDLQSVTLK